MLAITDALRITDWYFIMWQHENIIDMLLNYSLYIIM